MVLGSEIFKITKGGIYIYFIISLLTGVLAGSLTLIKDGNPMPLADNTIGLLLNGDNRALQLERDLLDENYKANIPKDYQTMVEGAMIREIVTNILCSLIVLYLIFKVIRWLFSYSHEGQGNKYTLLAILASFIVYYSIGLIYYLIKIYLDQGSINGDFIQLISSGIPFKSVGYGFKVLYVYFGGETVATVIATVENATA